MKVIELVERLEKLDGELEVVTLGGGTDEVYNKVVGIKIEIAAKKNNGYEVIQPDYRLKAEPKKSYTQWVVNILQG